VSLSQRVDGEHRAQAIGLRRRWRLLGTEVRVTAYHHALYFVRRGSRLRRRCPASPSRTSCRRTDPAEGSPIRENVFRKAAGPCPGRVRQPS
jgi:hypothetical protein